VKNPRSSIFLFLLILTSVYLWIQGNDEYGFEFNWATFFLSLLTLFSAVMLAIFFSRDGISLRVVYWFYSFLFLGLVPIFQCSANIWRFDIKLSVVPYAVFIVFLSHLFYLIGYNFGRKNVLNLKNSFRIRLISKKRLIISILISLVLTALLITKYGFSPSRSMVREAFGFTHSPLESVIEFLVRPTVFFLFLIFIHRLKYYENFIGQKFLLFLMILIVALLIGPFSANRSITFFLYFALIIILYPPIQQRSFLYFLILLFGVIGSFFQDAVRDYFVTGNLNQFSFWYFFQGHFDGFENLCHIITYESQNGIVYGNQLLGVIFFYIPRAFWPTKPTGTGDFLTWEYLDKHFVVSDGNIATPFFAEAFLNFNILGVIVFMMILGFFSYRLDKSYKRALYQITYDKSSFDQNSMNHFILIFYPATMGLFLFLLRGDMISSFALSLGAFVSFKIAYHLNSVEKTLK